MFSQLPNKKGESDECQEQKKNNDIFDLNKFAELVTQLPTGDRLANYRPDSQKASPQIASKLKLLTFQFIKDLNRSTYRINGREFVEGKVKISTDKEFAYSADEDWKNYDFWLAGYDALYEVCNGNTELLSFVSRYANQLRILPMMDLLEGGKLKIEGMPERFSIPRQSISESYYITKDKSTDPQSVKICFTLNYSKISQILDTMADIKNNVIELSPDKSYASITYAIKIQPTPENLDSPFKVTLSNNLRHNIKLTKRTDSWL